MNKAFATYTPRSKPMVYDAIAGREGCEPDSGNDWFGLKAFNQMCVFTHDPASVIFSQPPDVSYSIGPAVKGDQTQPFTAPWAVWVGSVGVRVGRADHVDPPADDLGENSSLYLKVKPVELTHAWNGKGDLAIAIQKDATTIELKKYVDDAGNSATYTWRGSSPALYYSGHVLRGDPSEFDQLVCYYLHPNPELPRVLYARFENEGFSEEHIVMPALRVGLKRLINAATVDVLIDLDAVPAPVGLGSGSFQGRIIKLLNAGVALYAIDEDGRDVVLTTPEHLTQFHDSANLAINLEGGSADTSAHDVDALIDHATIDIKQTGGQVFKPLIDVDNTPTVESMSLSVALDGGEITS